MKTPFLKITPSLQKTGFAFFDVICTRDEECIASSLTAQEVKVRFDLECPAAVIQPIEVKQTKKLQVLTLQECKAELLNGPGSGEPDALNFAPGGFSGHTSGEQRWKIEANPNGALIRVSLRMVNDKPVWKIIGHPTSSPGCVAFPGHHHHYDFNF
jgi:hypothetical protein